MSINDEENFDWNEYYVPADEEPVLDEDPSPIYDRGDYDQEWLQSEMERIYRERDI